MILEEIQNRIPLFKPEWRENYLKLKEHESAPKWNVQCGERLYNEDLPFINSFQKQLWNRRSQPTYPPKEILEWILEKKKYSPIFRERLTGINLEKDFYQIQPTNREILASRLHDIVPENEDISRLVVYDTSGTTGHAIHVPSHPKSVGCYDPMLEYVLSRFGNLPKIDHTKTICILVCFQENTITYSTVHSYWNGAGYAKINLHPKEWKNPKDREKYINAMQPIFITGDPISFVELMEFNLEFSPYCLLSTAIKVSPALKEKLEKKFNCPVVEFYSLNDTGPIGYTCPKNPDLFHLLPTDLFIEVLDDNNKSLGENCLGEITVTGGRNVYVPLLRYKTGDYGELDFSVCECGEVSPKIKSFEGRKLVVFEGSYQKKINPIDVSKIIRKYPIVQHQLVQEKNKNCLLKVRTLDPQLPFGKEEMLKELQVLFGNEIEIKIQLEPTLGNDKKIIPYISYFIKI